MAHVAYTSENATGAAMRILLVHNRYRFSGGEDVVVQAEKIMLENHNHEVAVLKADNTEISGPLKTISTGFKAVHSRAAKKRVVAELTRFRPNILHVHNSFPLFSPSIYYAGRQAGVAVVQTLHNYRLLCPNAMFFREGYPCEACLEKTVPLPAVFHACYRGSRAATAAVTSMITLHRALGTWKTMVDAYIALTEFSREKFIRGGLPADRVYVKPNFVQHASSTGQGDGGFAVFVGRLAEEKGVRTLLSAWEKLGRKMPLKIAGDGPLRKEVEARAQCMKEVELLGHLPKDGVAELLRRAHVLIVPSIWYEGFPIVVAEAFAAGVPVIASNIGALSELIHHRRTGLHYRAGNEEDLAAQVEWLITHEEERQQMRRAVRREFDLRYTADRNYEMLSAIYEGARQRQPRH
jgi:glycosyltransferase involved in cell wall biosynthesis